MPTDPALALKVGRLSSVLVSIGGGARGRVLTVGFGSSIPVLCCGGVRSGVGCAIGGGGTGISIRGGVRAIPREKSILVLITSAISAIWTAITSSSAFGLDSRL